ncbi:single-stranded DNA-binding protein [Megasphaera vaginalis (ex Srinivasan et al. 2021)]|uniref:single-stranded DNA-binding protein n=1 Tax=Megasphaera vaginalis (ex Srinivasan et al. 2021) TaxID=1111454 RepID=UPI0009DC2435|nr:single-stranded DNA-binding protein [Megasphaera vaginalis (ex Srinivasan et al. 2021)]
MNSVQISGNVSRDHNLRFTKNGTAVCRFSVACNDDYIDSNGEKKERTNGYYGARSIKF